ncbi:MAG: type II toxin-antitoxin system YafQ family toxin [Bacteroidia bacterium]|nr:type II toxin-antitoxin system YafQ family toxin [Bacteroidia bacterium]
MWTIETTNEFKKQAKRCLKRGRDMKKLERVIKQLETNGTVDSIYKPHKLSGNYSGLWECHIESDWLLIWKVNSGHVTIILTSTGTHSDLF